MRDAKLNRYAKTMRTQPTDTEKRLWLYLRGEQLGGWRFRRQHQVPPYILDLACLEACVAVEVDGGQHADSGYDRARDGFLRQRGWRILRIWNNEVLANSEGVAASVLAFLGGPRVGDVCPHPDPPPLGGGGE